MTMALASLTSQSLGFPGWRYVQLTHPVSLWLRLFTHSQYPRRDALVVNGSLPDLSGIFHRSGHER